MQLLQWLSETVPEHEQDNALDTCNASMSRTTRLLRMPQPSTLTCFCADSLGAAASQGLAALAVWVMRRSRRPRAHDVHVELEVTLKDLYLGHQYKAWPS